MGVAQNKKGGVAQVLVHVSTYQGSIQVPFLEPNPFRRVGHNVCVAGVGAFRFHRGGSQGQC